MNGEEGGYAHMHSTKPATLHDSPAGLAAWIGEKIIAWSSKTAHGQPAFPQDLLLATLTLGTGSPARSPRPCCPAGSTGMRPPAPCRQASQLPFPQPSPSSAASRSPSPSRPASWPSATSTSPPGPNTNAAATSPPSPNHNCSPTPAQRLQADYGRQRRRNRSGRVAPAEHTGDPLGSSGHGFSRNVPAGHDTQASARWRARTGRSVRGKPSKPPGQRKQIFGSDLALCVPQKVM